MTEPYAARTSRLADFFDRVARILSRRFSLAEIARAAHGLGDRLTYEAGQAVRAEREAKRAAVQHDQRPWSVVAAEIEEKRRAAERKTTFEDLVAQLERIQKLAPDQRPAGEPERTQAQLAAWEREHGMLPTLEPATGTP